MPIIKEFLAAIFNLGQQPSYRLWDWWPPAYLTYGLVATVIVFALHSLLLWAMMELTDAVPNATRERNFAIAIGVWAVVFGPIYIWVIIPLWKRVYRLVGGRGNIFLDPIANLDEAHHRKMEMERIKTCLKLRHFYGNSTEVKPTESKDKKYELLIKLPPEGFIDLRFPGNFFKGIIPWLLIMPFFVIWALLYFNYFIDIDDFGVTGMMYFFINYNIVMGYFFFLSQFKIIWVLVYRVLGGGQDVRYLELGPVRGSYGFPGWTKDRPFFYDKAERAKQRKGRTKNKWIPD